MVSESAPLWSVSATGPVSMPSARARRAVTTSFGFAGCTEMLERMQPRRVEAIDRKCEVELSRLVRRR